MNRFTTISNSELTALIDEWVKEPLAEEFDLSVQHVATIVSKNIKIISAKTTE